MIWNFVRISVYPASSVADLSAVDAELTAMELQVQGIKDRVREETLAIPKTKVPCCLSLSIWIYAFVCVCVWDFFLLGR